MSLDNSTPEKGPKTYSVPSGLLLRWYSQQKDIIDASASEHKRIMETTPGAERDPDVSLMAGRIGGASEVLRSFGELLIQSSTEQTP